ncbi:MAG: PepSY domain-containing protein [Bacteroidetes bacterium]|nr:PepSY domain-containing protein [Bacteroidota bacterium]
MRFKQLIKQLHLILGLLSGIIVFTVAITGCIYALEEEVRNIVYEDVLFVKAGGISKVSFTELIDAARRKHPKPGIKNIRIKSDSLSSVEIILKNKQSVYVNPYTAEVLGTANKDTDFFGTILKIHRHLYLGEPGKLITGSTALIFIGMLISGIVLWWPQNKKILKQKFSISRNVRWKKRNYDLHSVLGFYAAWIIIFTALTGIIWSFKWVENSMYWLSNSKKEERKMLHSNYTANALPITIDDVIKKTGNLYTQSEECFISMPEDSAGVYKVTIRYENNGFYKKQDQLLFDQYSGNLIKAQLYENTSTGDKLKATNLAIHTGKVFGTIGEIIVFFAALIAASLPITGFIMWWGKRKRI